MQSDAAGLDAFKETLDRIGATHVHIGIFDPDGQLRVKRVERAKAEKLLAGGYPFCDVLYNWDIAEETFGGGAYRDVEGRLFPETVRAWPFEGQEAVCIADYSAAFGERSARNQLLRQLDKAQAMGFSVHSAFEFEFFLLDEDAASLRAGGFADPKHYALANRTYSLETLATEQPLLSGLEEMTRALGIGMDALHTELGPGCLEVPLTHAEGVKAADDAALFKNFAKSYFRRNGLTACFMSKLKETLSGQSGHLHVSLRDAEGRPVFSDLNDPDRLSDTARHFIGGLVTLMPELLALCAQTVNAYRRMVPGMWAPTHASWGIQNRTVAARVMNDSPSATRVEFRVPSADTNPHAALAMCLGAGLWGIENRIEPGAPSEGDLHAEGAAEGAALPMDLGEAARRLRASDRARAIFGDVFVEGFADARRHEYETYLRHVSAWERERYLEVV
ncbi:glutamine synthetase family protein [Maritimibacter alkaliphilus]|uniref:glutamine synthetase family protein n=1 Tax=Maritimibacter alkaliphilus TaxID=404236 RepID=UPI001C97D98F|nr:glutamine synthetase [Maritimibacter alkaliphilus]MBY6091821.1 glutamine synthetase [Maritimibacter alkaliphilus]